MEDVRSVSGGQMGMDKGLRLVTHGVDRVRFGIRSVEGQPEADSCPKSVHPKKKSPELASSILNEIPRARLRLDMHVISVTSPSR
jgi:hypothetical protein